MRFLFLGVLALLGVFVASPSADAVGLQPLNWVQSNEASSNLLVRVHSAGDAFDELRNYGYKKLRLVSEYHDHYGKPVFKFKACRKGRIYFLKVNWYGDIISSRKGGFCIFRVR